MLSGTAPVPVASDPTSRRRLGDRQFNRALHAIAVTRMRGSPPTLGYPARRRAEGNRPRNLPLLARHLYRELNNPAAQATWQT